MIPLNVIEEECVVSPAYNHRITEALSRAFSLRADEQAREASALVLIQRNTTPAEGER
jgi:hypothetical protein